MNVNPFDYFDEIFYINLDRRNDRNEQALAEFERVGIVDRVRRISGFECSTPAIGCHLSHAECFRQAIKEDLSNILIFEDDVEFFPNAVENLAATLNELTPFWDMFYLGANLDRFPATQVREHLARITGAFATHAYAVRHTLFEKLYTVNNCEDIPHNDVYYSEHIHPKYNCYLALPLVAGQRDSFSDIQGTVMSSNSVFLSRVESNVIWK